MWPMSTPTNCYLLKLFWISLYVPILDYVADKSMNWVFPAGLDPENEVLTKGIYVTILLHP